MRYWYFLILPFLFAGCTKKANNGKCPVTCGRPGATLFFSGYTNSELDSVKMKTYKIGGTFDSVATETVYTSLQPISVPGTTLNGLGKIYLNPYRDYEIIVPGISLDVHIAMKDTTAIDTFVCDNIPKGGCFTEFLGAQITGDSSNFYATGPSNWYIAIKK